MYKDVQVSREAGCQERPLGSIRPTKNMGLGRALVRERIFELSQRQPELSLFWSYRTRRRFVVG